MCIRDSLCGVRIADLKAGNCHGCADWLCPADWWKPRRDVYKRQPQQITIPMSVMFRFFPTVAEEWSAIGDAMRMRGVRFGGGKASAILEYRIVPMMICSVKIGEELSQAALTRGLDGPVKRTNICKLGFHVQDVIFLLICLGAFAAQIYVLAARG